MICPHCNQEVGPPFNYHEKGDCEAAKLLAADAAIILQRPVQCRAIREPSPFNIQLHDYAAQSMDLLTDVMDEALIDAAKRHPAIEAEMMHALTEIQKRLAFLIDRLREQPQ